MLEEVLGAIKGPPVLVDVGDAPEKGVPCVETIVNVDVNVLVNVALPLVVTNCPAQVVE
jgi:hypothetical protein